MRALVTVAFASLIIILSIKYPHLMLNPGELSNSHQNLKEKCTSCHSYFSGIDYQKCVECHNLKLIGIDTINNQQLTGNVEKISFHDKLVDQNCTNCHSDHNGIVPKSFLNSFDHTYLKPEIHDECVSCHAKPDDSLHSHLNNLCHNCHQTDQWKFIGEFDHALLEGIDRNKCSICHKAPSDQIHDSFSASCNECHNIYKWYPSTFDHSTYFVLDNDHNVSCKTCHVKSETKQYTCYGCHEHSAGKIDEEHSEHGIYQVENCIKCHKSGNKHEAFEGEEGNNKKEVGHSKEKSEHGEDDD